VKGARRAGKGEGARRWRCRGGLAGRGRGWGTHRELDDSSRALDGLNAVTIRKLLEDVTCESELCEASVEERRYSVGVAQSHLWAGAQGTPVRVGKTENKQRLAGWLGGWM
jgi:hypothetical protein